MPETPTPQLPPSNRPAMAPQPKTYNKVAHEQVRERVGRYKRRIAVAAIVGFGVVSLLIAHPDLGIAAPSSSTTNQQDPGNYFSQQGGNFNGNGTSQQPPSTSSNAS